MGDTLSQKAHTNILGLKLPRICASFEISHSHVCLKEKSKREKHRAWLCPTNIRQICLQSDQQKKKDGKCMRFGRRGRQKENQDGKEKCRQRWKWNGKAA